MNQNNNKVRFKKHKKENFFRFNRRNQIEFAPLKEVSKKKHGNGTADGDFIHLFYFFLSALMLLTSIGSTYAKGDKYKTKYSRMDKNHNGIVTRDEWRGTGSIFQASDWNGDGVLSGNETTGGARRGDDYDRLHSDDRFGDLDENKDSVVSRHEWDGIIGAFNRLDDNHDGVLSRREFVNPRAEGTDPITKLDRDRDGHISGK